MIPVDSILRDEANKWCLYLVSVAVASFVTQLISKSIFGFLGENVTLKIRAKLYESIL